MEDFYMRLVARERLVEADALVARRRLIREARLPGLADALRVRLGMLLVDLGRRLAGKPAAALTGACREPRMGA